MKKFLLLLVLVCTNAFAGITDLKLSTAQIFDVQWSISGGKLNASGFNYIYASVNYATQATSAARWTAAQTTDAGSNGRYIGFFNSTTNPGTYGMAVFNSDGTKYKIINNTGSFRALADGAIFYNGNGMWGTLITTKQGYALGGSGQFTVTQEYPTNSQLASYEPPSSTPLASGQTATPPSSGGSAPTWPSTSDITTVQTTKKSQAAGRTSEVSQGNKMYLEQKSGSSNNVVTIEQTGFYNSIGGLSGSQYAVINGSSNTVSIKQGDGNGRNLMEFSIVGNSNAVTLWQARNPSTGLQDGGESGGHYTGLNIAGSSNTVAIKQGNNGGVSSGHVAFMDVTGSTNTGTVKQSNDGEKVFFGVVTGSSNVFEVLQQGTGAQYFDLMLSGNGHTVSANQKDGGAHKATVNLTNSGGSSSVTLVQQGSTAQNINITQSCATLSGCSVTVTQGQ